MILRNLCDIVHFNFVFREISQIRFPKSNKSLFDHDVIFWFGDMNFRLETSSDLSNDDFRRLCADENSFRDMIVFDQVSFLQVALFYFCDRILIFEILELDCSWISFMCKLCT